MSRGALTRLGIAGLVTYAPTLVTNDPTGAAIVTALATVAAGYLINRSNAVEDQDLEAISLSKNHHLQIALAGAFRNALQEIKTQNHQDIFEAWDKLLDAALNDPTRLLAVVIPAEFDLILDATNPHLDQAGPFDEAKSLLSVWLAYQQAYNQRGTYPLNPPRETPLPPDLLKTLEAQFPEAFQRAFAHLLVSNDHEYARRAFERRALEEVVAVGRANYEILKRLDQRVAPPPAPAKIRTFTSKLPTVDPYVVGREKELAFLDEAWANPSTNVVQIIASGGTGKTALMDKWLRRHLGEATIFGWSFYSQGSSEDRQASSDPFFAEALRFFGIQIERTASIWGKAEALAEKLREERIVLVLDALEPLQDASGHLKDALLKALLRELDTQNSGLVICTTRVRVSDLPEDPPRTRSWDLDNLSPKAAIAYLRKLSVIGENHELEKVSSDYGNHALALTLLGRYLVDFHDGDVRSSVEIPKLMVVEIEEARHARRMVQAYELMLGDKAEGRILRAFGYFNRPAEPEALNLLVNMRNRLFKTALKRLRSLRLVLRENDSNMLDCHPLVREHFAQYATMRGHALLFDHYQKQASYRPDKMQDMVPLFCAIYHGCQAGRLKELTKQGTPDAAQGSRDFYQETLEKVYREQVLHGREFYLVNDLGAFGTDLSLLVGFFTLPWTQPVTVLSPSNQSWVVSNAAFDLRALGRLADAVEPMRASAESGIQQGHIKNAATGLCNLSELLLTLGRVSEAVAVARESVEFAERSGDTFQRMACSTALADALHQYGDPTAAALLFVRAEQLGKEDDPQHPFLYSLWGYRYSDLLLTQDRSIEVMERAKLSLVIDERNNSVSSIALDHLCLARAGDASHFLRSIDGLRTAGILEFLPLGLLARGTQHDLDEVYKIATRSGMRLHLTDYHLKQADLDLAHGNQTKAREHTQKAADLIQATGYHRRDPDLARLREQLAQTPDANQPGTQ